ncbi:colanic acid exporter [Paenibacillus psychroresistens]|uniref:Colanic acid exporter n=1 Tax=Paenibacillus psychroresistens TaxID=1778678 RepID=A0A6B8RDY3_9BACL|nr:MOP flippase family protein [Paenibacillus psychroresistens]QGQ94419.1 colanic acid exporter [Paenibacillus psychroresistens]
MSLKIKGITAMKWSSMGTLFSIVIQVTQLITISRMLKPSDYGLIGMIMVVIGFAATLGDMGISNAIIHRQQVTKNQLSSLYIVNLVTSAFVCTLVWFSAPYVALFYQEPQLIDLMHWMCWICLIPAFGQQSQVLFQKELKFKQIAKIDIISYLIGFLVVFFGAYYGYGVYALVWSYLANAAFKSICLTVLGWRIWRPKLHFAWADLKGFIRYGMYQLGASSLQMLISNFDYLIIGRLLGAEKLGYYTFAFQLCVMPFQKIFPLISQVSLPIFAKIQDQLGLLRKSYLQLIGMVSYVNAPIYFGLIVVAPYLVPFLFGEKWGPSIPLIQVLAAMVFIRTIVMPMQPLLQAKGRADIVFKFTVISMLLQLPALTAGAMIGGIKGVTVAYLSVQVLIFFVHYLYTVRSVLGPCFWQYVGNLAPSIGCSLLMCLGVLGINYLFDLISIPQEQQYHLAIQVVGGVLLYGGIIYFFNRQVLQSIKKIAINKGN